MEADWSLCFNSVQRRPFGLCGEEGAHLLPADSSDGTGWAPRLSEPLPMPRTARPKAPRGQLHARGGWSKSFSKSIKLTHMNQTKAPPTFFHSDF